MLVEFELPGFPPPDNRPQCLGCTALVPIGITDTNRTCYTHQDLSAWEASIPNCGTDPNTDFPDPRGLTVEHDDGCEYAGIPPVALWQRDLSVANRAWTRVRQARTPCP